MPKIRTLIVDDESPARLRLRELLQKRAGFEVVAECATGAEAVDAINRLRPELLFLDVQMPTMDGFQVLRDTGLGGNAVTIFVTAYDRYALAAFKSHALDYLLKPFRDERFGDAIEHAVKHLATRPRDELAERVLRMLERPHPITRLAVKTAGRLILLCVEEIDWVEAAGVYVDVHVGEKCYLHRSSLSELEDRLATARFVRIHRSTLVNLDRVREIAPRTHGEFSVVLTNGIELRLSRGCRARLEQLLGQSL